MTGRPPFLPILAVALVVLASGCVQKVEPVPGDTISKASGSLVNATHTIEPSSWNGTPISTTPPPPSPPSDPTPPPSPPSSPTPPPSPPTPPADDTRASDRMMQDEDNGTTPAPPPPAERNDTVAWNGTIGERQTCVPAFGIPLCPPTGSGATSRSKLLGNASVTLGNLTLSFDGGQLGSGMRMRLAAGSGCDADSCATLRATQADAAGGSPLRLAVGAIKLKANETLVLIVEPDCGDSLGACAPSQADFDVAGWLVRSLA